MSVYFISNGAYVKIGVASNPKKRLKALQTGNPHKLELLRVIKGGHAEEAALHAHFAHLRVNGEWFKYHSEMLHIEPRVVANSSGENRNERTGSWLEFPKKGTKNPKRYAQRRSWINVGGVWKKSKPVRVKDIPPMTEAEYQNYKRHQSKGD